MAGNIGMRVSCPGLWHKGHRGVPKASGRVEVELEDRAG